MADITQSGAGQTPLWSDTGWPHINDSTDLAPEEFVGERALREDGFYRRIADQAVYRKRKMYGFLNKSGPLTPERDREQAQAEWQQIQAMLTSGSTKLSPADCVRLRELVEAGLDRCTVRKEERIVPVPQPVVDVRRGRAIELD